MKAQEIFLNRLLSSLSFGAFKGIKIILSKDNQMVNNTIDIPDCMDLESWIIKADLCTIKIIGKKAVSFNINEIYRIEIYF